MMEIMVALAILSLLVLTLYTVFQNGVEAWSRARQRIEIYQTGRFILDQMSRELAGSVNFMRFDGTEGGSDPDTIVYVTDYDGSTHIINWGIYTGTLKRSYQMNPTNLSNPTWTSMNVTDLVTDLQFGYIASGTTDLNWGASVDAWSGPYPPEAVKIDLTLEDDDGNEYNLQTGIYIPACED